MSRSFITRLTENCRYYDDKKKLLSYSIKKWFQKVRDEFKEKYGDFDGEVDVTTINSKAEYDPKSRLMLANSKLVYSYDPRILT
ncbi:hypothetical protein BGZ46_001513, partial [Entomortierella lignicola]